MSDSVQRHMADPMFQGFARAFVDFREREHAGSFEGLMQQRARDLFGDDDYAETCAKRVAFKRLVRRYADLA